jgi:death-on-curing protein
VREPHWVDERALLLLHAESLAEHGGLEGVRDIGLLRSALARPQNLLAYGETTDLARLAAAYGVGIARNHPFVDGNKRAAFIATGLFLALNGLSLTASPAEATVVMMAVAAGDMVEDEFAHWLRAHLQPAPRE